ncbi:hypothetical protein CDD83_3556 [Cordyceps sp. RAO-2017]|nr:hypothetical protein CDD83_3556 [Cordyceps sp. RAO-2017]
MGWLYDTSVALSEEQKLVRRQTIDLYACIAHYSALVPPLVLLLVRLVRRAAPLWSPWARRSSPDGHGRYAEVPRSPIAKAHRRDASGSVTVRWTRLRWWLCDDVYFRGAHWGRREEWLLGFAWALWLLALCVMDTGTDYLHLTKRFGAIAVSQLPIQFLLALKALNPFAFAFHSSHEDVNRYHRVLGRIVYGLLILHALFYNYFFLVAGIWRKRFFALIVFLGVVAFAAMSALTTTSLVRVRQYSYRLFFITHLLAAILVPVLIFFHAPSARLYLVETLLIFGLDLAVRKMTTVTSASSFEVVRGTNLVKISSAIPLRKLANFKARPGSHVYLNVPPRSRPATNRAVFDFLFNPFTCAAGP